MQTITIDVINDNVMHLLKDLERLHFIKLLKKDSIQTKTKLSDKYRGVFTKEDAKSFNEHTQQMRKEWDNT